MVKTREITSLPTVVVMAKRPVPGQVKTRLRTRFTADQAARIHAAMLRCVLSRVRKYVPGEHVLALGIASQRSAPCSAAPSDNAAPDVQAEAAETAKAWGLTFPEGWRVVDQGEGGLGERLDHVWQVVGGGPVIFLGVDSPDVPSEALSGIAPLLTSHDAAIGPVADGGYWTLAASRYLPMLLQGIDWGSASVYHQTVETAACAGLRCGVLPAWHDVDEPADFDALLRRLDHVAIKDEANEPALVRLRQDLLAIMSEVPS